MLMTFSCKIASLPFMRKLTTMKMPERASINREKLLSNFLALFRTSGKVSLSILSSLTFPTFLSRSSRSLDEIFISKTSGKYEKIQCQQTLKLFARVSEPKEMSVDLCLSVNMCALPARLWMHRRVRVAVVLSAARGGGVRGFRVEIF